jgi:hypothetical protein
MSGLGRGLSSLVMHVSEGTLTSVSDLSSSLMRNVDSLSLDRYTQPPRTPCDWISSVLRLTTVVSSIECVVRITP